MKHKLDNEDKLYLKEKLGAYLSAKELRKKNISLRTLNAWREHGKLESVMLYGVLYYSLKSIKNAIQTADIKDLQSTTQVKRRQPLKEQSRTSTYTRHIPWS